MRDIATYLLTFGGELVAALSMKVRDPVAWGLLIGGLLLGAAVWRRAWVFAGATFLLILGAMVIESSYFASPVARGDRAALAVVYVIGVMAGRALGVLWNRFGAQHP